MKQQSVIFMHLLIVIGVLGFALPRAHADLTDGLVSYYPFDGDAIDAHGPNDATLHGNAFATGGVIDQGMNFDGDAYSHVNTAQFEARTIAFWMQPTSTYTPATIGNNRGVFDLGDNNGDAYGWIGSRWSASTTELFALHTGTNSSGAWSTHALGITQFTAGTWYHVALVWDHSTYRLYLDGQDKGTPDEINPFTNPIAHLINADEINFGVARLGNDPNNSDRAQFGSLIFDEAAIWNRSLTADQITQLHTSGVAIPAPLAIIPGAIALAWIGCRSKCLSHSKP